jgi:hypothetical protein
MKKILMLAIFLVGFACISGFSYAGGASWNTSLTPSANSAAADGSAAITFSVYAYYYVCSLHDSSGYLVTSLDPNYCASNGYGTSSETGQNITGSPITVTGSGNTLSASTLTTDSSGHGSFTLKSTTAETKTVSVTTPPGSVLASSTVNFTSQAAPATPKTKSTTTPSPTEPASTPAAPASPTISSVAVGSTKLTDISNIELASNQSLQISGKTVPGGVVTLTIHSTPRTVTTTANNDGVWSYTVTGLEPGNHTIESSVKDTATGQSSPPAQVLAFTVKAAPLAATSTKGIAKKSSSKMSLIIGVLAILAAAGVGGWFYLRHKRTAASPTATIPV